MSANTLNQIFNIVPVEPAGVPTVDIKQDSTEDFKIAKSNLVTLIKTATEAVQIQSEIASAQQTPEAMMALASLLNAATKSAQALMGVNKDMASMGKGEGPSELHNHVHFSGSTEDLARMLKGNK